MSGAVLSDQSIRDAIENGRMVISPLIDRNIQPSSIDITLGGDKPLVLKPKRWWRWWHRPFKLATTAEWFELPADIQGQVHGRSSIGRLGVLVHFTAGLIDPGFAGHITLECMAFDEDQTFYPGDRIGQVSFMLLDRPASQPYHGRYQGQTGTTESRFKHAEDE